MGVESHLPIKWGHLPAQASVGRGREENSRQSRREGECVQSPGKEEDIEMSLWEGSKGSLHGSSGKWVGVKDWCGRGESRPEGAPDTASVSIWPSVSGLKAFLTSLLEPWCSLLHNGPS